MLGWVYPLFSPQIDSVLHGSLFLHLSFIIHFLSSKKIILEFLFLYRHLLSPLFVCLLDYSVEFKVFLNKDLVPFYVNTSGFHCCYKCSSVFFVGYYWYREMLCVCVHIYTYIFYIWHICQTHVLVPYHVCWIFWNFCIDDHTCLMPNHKGNTFKLSPLSMISIIWFLHTAISKEISLYSYFSNIFQS